MSEDMKVPCYHCGHILIVRVPGDAAESAKTDPWGRPLAEDGTAPHPLQHAADLLAECSNQFWNMKVTWMMGHAEAILGTDDTSEVQRLQSDLRSARGQMDSALGAYREVERALDAFLRGIPEKTEGA